MDYITTIASPLGMITMASDGEALTGLWFASQKYELRTLDPEHEERDLPIFRQTACWLEHYFRGNDPGTLPPLAPRGTAFQQTVWQILRSIPYGSTMTYGEIAALAAKELGREHMSAQAVGGAVGHNPISILIPCHRVVGRDGSLTGYAGGIDRKKRLLTLEGVVEVTG